MMKRKAKKKMETTMKTKMTMIQIIIRMYDTSKWIIIPSHNSYLNTMYETFFSRLEMETRKGSRYQIASNSNATLEVM